MHEVDAKNIFGEFSCSVCGYLCESDLRMKAHIDKVHPNFKQELHEKWSGNKAWRDKLDV